MARYVKVNEHVIIDAEGIDTISSYGYDDGYVEVFMRSGYRHKIHGCTMDELVVRLDLEVSSINNTQ